MELIIDNLEEIKETLIENDFLRDFGCFALLKQGDIYHRVSVTFKVYRNENSIVDNVYITIETKDIITDMEFMKFLFNTPTFYIRIDDNDYRYYVCDKEFGYDGEFYMKELKLKPYQPLWRIHR